MNGGLQMSLEHKKHFKEVSPTETVTKLKNILSELGIETEETWSEESFVETYSLRLTFKGTTIGTNGKGITREYALASAYGELFERYQNNLLGIIISKKESGSDFYEAPDEKIVTAEEIVSYDNSLMNLYFSNRSKKDTSIKEKAKAFKSTQKMDLLKHNLENRYIVVPFYSMRDEKIVYLPRGTCRRFYGSNGMCAGNTPAEALVQGLSEIIERVVQKKLFLEKPTLPDVPDDYIKRYPYIDKMYAKLKEQKDYYVTLKDCSFGGKYPVAALVIVEKNTGNYGVKLGCHPDFGVAMERAFTEATQGNDIFTYAQRSHIDFSNLDSSNSMNIYNSYKLGVGQYPYQLFGNKPTYEFVPLKDVSSMSNQEILNYWVTDIINDGYDVLIRDVSNLGFPSYYIVIPGLSEMWEDKDVIFRAYNTRFFISPLVANPTKINRSNTKYIIATMEFFMNCVLENTMESYCKFTEDWPCENFGCDTRFFVVMCHVINEEFSIAAEKMKYIVNMAQRASIPKDQFKFYKGMYNYFVAMSQIHDHNKVLEYLRVFYSEDTCKKLDNLFCVPKQVMVKLFVPKSTDSPKLQEVKDSYKQCQEIIHKLHSAQIKNPINQKDIYELFA